MQRQYRNSFALSDADGESLLNASSIDDRLDSDIEADIQQTSLCSEITTSDGEKLSISSIEALGISETSNRSSLSLSDSKQSIFFRKTVLSGVSSQLNSFSSRADVGSPTCLVRLMILSFLLLFPLHVVTFLPRFYHKLHSACLSAFP
ncbi:unnamed protein product [Dicrocoelium dendriticum]|nr:unnamed protein product [Dicrocoelium dendriticum]